MNHRYLSMAFRKISLKNGSEYPSEADGFPVPLSAFVCVCVSERP
jgi:hypothetical protein